MVGLGRHPFHQRLESIVSTGHDDIAKFHSPAEDDALAFDVEKFAFSED